MRMIASLFLSSLLAIMAYGIFWLVCLNFTTTQLREAVREALGAELTYGTPQWVPDPARVTMDLPNARLSMPQGEIKEIRAPNLRLSIGFLVRDRWTMVLPARVEVTLATGTTLLLETKDGEVMWVRDGNRLTLRAKSARLLDLKGNELALIGDVMLERKSSDTGVTVNLASRPRFASGEGVLSGQLVMPPQAFNNMVSLLGHGGVPGLKEIVHNIADSLYKSGVAGDSSGATLRFENVSFRTVGPNAVSAGVYGRIKVRRDGRLEGKLVVTSDRVSTVMGWVEQARVMQPRRRNEEIGVARFARGLQASRATVGMENMQDTLMLNGQPVGQLPQVMDVVNRLWP